MEFGTLRESSILAGTDAVEHSSIAKNWTTDMQQSFPYQHKNVLEDAMDTIFKLSCALKEETKNEMSTSSSFWVTIFFLSIFAFSFFVSLGLSCFVFIVSIIVTAYALVQHFMSYVDGYVENVESYLLNRKCKQLFNGDNKSEKRHEISQCEVCLL